MNDLNLADGHLDELLSAELDGELSPEELEMVAQHIAVCERCRLEREELWRVKTSIQQLGPVEPPFGFEQRLLRAGRAAESEGRRHRWSTGRVTMSLVATAAVWVAVVGFGADLGTTRQVKPPVSAARAFVGGSPDFGGSKPAMTGLGTSDLPGSLDGRPQAASFKTANGQLVTFGKGGSAITVYFQAGQVDWGSLSGGKRSLVSGLPGMPWQSDDGQAPALVFQDKDAAVVLVGDVDHKDLVKAAKDVPPYDKPDPSIGQRLKDAGESLVDTFGLGT